MNRLLLAIQCFLWVLFRNRLPPAALSLVAPTESEPVRAPREVPPEGPAPPPAREVAQGPVPAIEAREPGKERAQSGERGEAQALVDEGGRQRPPLIDEGVLRQHGAVQMLALLQREGRLIDFLMEDVASYGDAQIGAAVRDIHRGCRKALTEHFKVVPVRPEPDEAAVRVEGGYDPSRIRLIGNLSGRPPFHGTLRHHGWRAEILSFPTPPRSHDPGIIAPAEVELDG